VPPLIKAIQQTARNHCLRLLSQFSHRYLAVRRLPDRSSHFAPLLSREQKGKEAKISQA
jgi:hypothetical protein